MTKQDLQNELKAAMLAKDEEKKSTLRMLISAIGYYEIQKGGAGYEATDEDILAVIQKEAKQRKDAITQYNDGGRPELAAKEEKELKLLQTYLPAQMGEDEIRRFVKEAISNTGASSLQDIGKIMGALMPKVKGKADGGLVNKIVKEELSS
jgi:uncharacterized protein YqeY